MLFFFFFGWTTSYSFCVIFILYFRAYIIIKNHYEGPSWPSLNGPFSHCYYVRRTGVYTKSSLGLQFPLSCNYFREGGGVLKGLCKAKETQSTNEALAICHGNLMVLPPMPPSQQVRIWPYKELINHDCPVVIPDWPALFTGRLSFFGSEISLQLGLVLD